LTPSNTGNAGAVVEGKIWHASNAHIRSRTTSAASVVAGYAYAIHGKVISGALNTKVSGVALIAERRSA